MNLQENLQIQIQKNLDLIKQVSIEFTQFSKYYIGDDTYEDQWIKFIESYDKD